MTHRVKKRKKLELETVFILLSWTMKVCFYGPIQVFGYKIGKLNNPVESNLSSS